MRELLLGCGHTPRAKRIGLHGRNREFEDLTTLDMDPTAGADVEWDMENLPLPFRDESFDEIHAYEILEHVGRQGDWRFFFAQFADFWRLLVPGGLLAFSCPVPFGESHTVDPGHSRFIAPNTIAYLNQPLLTSQIGTTMLTDYRWFFKADFDLVTPVREQDGSNYFLLTAVKPSRISV